MCILPVFVEEAVPKIHPIQLNQTRHKKTVRLKCDASYQNYNFKILEKFNVILSWIKDAKVLASKIVDYEYGNHTVSINPIVTVNGREDAGIYVCQSQLALKHGSYSITESKQVELRSKLMFWNVYYHMDTLPSHIPKSKIGHLC